MSLSKMAAALSLAGLGAGGGMAGGKDLTCGVCREVYRSPRFLPCFHTFCVYCVEDLSRAHDRQPFPCPSCQKLTVLPPDGALGLQINHYITEEELQQARDGPRTTPCRRAGHDGNPLVLYCELCKEALCMVCKMTRHENHRTNSLADAATVCQQRLRKMKGPLEDTIRCLTERSAMVNDSLQAIEAEGQRVKEEVQAQLDLLVAKAYRWRDVVFAEVDQFNVKTKGELTADAARVQRELDALLQLGQRVQRAMGDASDAETVEVEREMREGRGNKENLQGVKNAVCRTHVRPSLNFDPACLADDAIRRLLGFPAEVVVPPGFKEVLVPVYQCGKDGGGASRRVHSLRHREEGLIDISYGETLKIRLSFDENLKVLGKPFVKDARRDGLLLGQREKYLSQYMKGNVTDKGKWMKEHGVFAKHWSFLCQNPVAFNKTTNRDLSAVVEEETTTTIPTTKTGHCCVHLSYPQTPTESPYRYKAPNTDFHPTDVCFWSDGGEVKLLVADAGNDSVHVVRLGSVAVLIQQGRFCPESDFDEVVCFERYLALGDAHLVHPTALNVDDENRVWVGCDNGWVLRCDKARENVEPRAGGGLRLGVDNGSRSSSHPSGVDTPSVTGVRVENDSQSGDDGTSVAGVRVENDSQSGVNTPSVAGLRVENDSQSGDDGTSVAGVRVENDSQPGVDTPSVAGLRVENDSQSGDDGTSVAGVRVENDSQSGVNTPSVAGLRVENDSQSGDDGTSVAGVRVENASLSGDDSASVDALVVDNDSNTCVDSKTVDALFWLWKTTVTLVSTVTSAVPGRAKRP